MCPGSAPVWGARALGVIGSLAPCQRSGDAGATAYVAGRAPAGPRAVLRTALAYLAGKAAVYAAQGAVAVAAGRALPPPLLALPRRPVGPATIVAGLYLLGMPRLPSVTLVPWRLLRRLERRLPEGTGAALLLAVGYSLAFCPTMALLFFGVLIPLGIQSGGGLALPSLFVAGTALPLLAVSAVLALGLGVRCPWLQGVRRLHRHARTATGTRWSSSA